MLSLFVIGVIIFLISSIAWGVVTFQVMHNHRTDLLSLMWIFLAIMWIGTITVNISNVMMK